ncbi:hypothetical protein A6U97_27665 [Agrobacterium tumefaciens]|uniref:AAA family ATPase n=1 Tax=Agrobacterium tumefaciens TaxID=358 RepID=UPI00080F8BDF|nr:hypothetical protein A6U97_27665 [Agrobacterium tumefaciens]
MPDHQPSERVWDVMGIADRIQEVVTGLASGEIRTALISGPPGSGKTWLARSIAATFVQSGGMAFRGVGDEGEATRRLYAFQRARAETDGSFLPISPQRSFAIEASKVSSGILRSHEALEALSAAVTLRRRTLFLSEAEQSILSELAEQAADKPLLIVADNLHWWDETSLGLLRTMLASDLSKAYPFVRDIRLLAISTDETYQKPIWREAYEERLLPLMQYKVQTRYLTDIELGTVSSAIGLPPQLDVADRSLIFDVSGGHLTIVAEASRYLSDHGGQLEALPADDKDRFIEDLFLERLRKIGPQKGLAERLLGAAAIVGNVAFRDELHCLLKDERDDILPAIDACRKLGFVEEKDDRIEFRHEFIRRFFSNRLGSQEGQLRSVFSECLRVLTPWDYARRAGNLLRGRDAKRAADIFVAAALANLRAGLPKKDMLDGDALELIRASGHEELLDDFEAAYRALAAGENEKVASIVESMGPAYPTIILAEMEFLRSLSELHSRSNRRRKALIGRLRSWQEHIQHEFEQGLRLMLVLRSALVLEADKSEARDLDAELVRRLSERIYFDKTAEAKIHAIGRSAESLFLPDIAIRRVERAERYHRPSAGSPPAEPAEYFRCLSNLTALSISNGDYERAAALAQQGIELADRFDGAVFPRRDLIHTMDVMARFRAGKLTASSAIEEQHDIIERYGVRSDRYYPCNHLGVYLCLGDRLDEAKTLFQELRDELLAIGDPEPNPLYFVSANFCSARFLSGEDPGQIQTEWDALTDLVRQNPYETSALLQRRHQIIADFLRQPTSMSPAEWDSLPIVTESRPLHPVWAEIGRGFRMPDVQFWSMY